MGTQEDITSKSDSGYDDAASLSAPDANQSHPLTKKGYDVATAATLQVGDVFEFLWADAHEYQWEWKCLGYVRFIVLRHTDTFPHYAACIPVSVGNKGMGDFTKPGIDHHQQGFIFAEGDRNPGVRQPGGGSALPYSPIGVELKPGKLRVNSNSRANYADIVEVDHDAEIMVVGSVNRYFDRLRRNVNRAVMRQILRRSLEEYCERKARGSTLDLRSKTIESNPARFVMGDGIAEERSEDDLPHDEPARQDDPPQSPTYSHRNGKKHDEAVAGLEESSNRRSTGNVLSEDSDDFEGRRRQRDHRQRQDQGHSRRVSRTSRTSRQSREILPLEEELEKAEASRPGWFRRFSSILDKEKEKEHAQDWSNYAARPNHRRSTSVETQTGANHESRQSSPRRKPRARPTVDPVESRISADPRSMIDLAAAGRSRPNPRPNSAGE